MANSELQKWICLTFGQNTADAETIWISRWPNSWFSLYTNKGISLGQAYDLPGRKILELRKHVIMAQSCRSFALITQQIFIEQYHTDYFVRINVTS